MRCVDDLVNLEFLAQDAYEVGLGINVKVASGLIDKEHGSHVEVACYQKTDKSEEGSQAVAALAYWCDSEIRAFQLTDIDLHHAGFVYRYLDGKA